jgi:ketosteroid isomerase-like protein
MDRYRRAWIGYEAALQELIDAGDDVVLVLRETARARGTEMLVERNIHQVVTIHEGRAIRLRVYPTKQEAFDAVGLRA